MPTQLPVVAGSLPEGFCYPSSPQELLNAIAAALVIQYPGTFTGVNFSNSVPGVNDRDKAWIRTGVSGQPDRTYVFLNGNWVSLHPEATGNGRRLFIGSLTDLQTYDGGEVGAVSEATGPMWEEDTNFQARFLVGPGTLPSTTVIGVSGATATGGEEKHVLTIAELPAHTHDILFQKRTATGDVGSDSGSLMGRDSVTNKTSTATGSNDGHNTLPPYRGIYVIKRTARLYYRA